MNYLLFREKLFPLGCFNTQQARIFFPSFNRTNFTRWVKKGLLVRLRQDFYAFPEYLQSRDFFKYIANCMYNPSYISLQTALSHYGMIPETVVQITSISTLKTARFQNTFGQYSYQNVKEELFFGYEPKAMDDNKAFFLATPEKALLDLLYLNPYCNTMEELKELRLDEDYMIDDLNHERLDEYLDRFHSKALSKRVALLKEVYGL